MSSVARAGPPFVTDDPEPTEDGKWEINSALAGTWVQGGSAQALPVIDANYGAAPGVQLHVQPQLGYVRMPGGQAFGLGDTQIGAKLRFLDEDEEGWVPMAATYPIVTLPTGDRRRGLGAGTVRTFLPLWLQKSFGNWTVYGGAGYGINPGPNGENAWFAGGVALYQFTERLQLGGEMFFQAAQAPGEKSAPGFNLGGQYNFSAHYHLLFSAGSGLANQAETNRFSAYLAVQAVY